MALASLQAILLRAQARRRFELADKREALSTRCFARRFIKEWDRARFVGAFSPASSRRSRKIGWWSEGPR